MKNHILVLRFSAMGDVLMTVPVIDAFARQHPDVRLTVCSRAWAKPVFALLPPNVNFVVADLKGEHSGWKGLNFLCRKLLAIQPTAMADLHDVLRTKWLRTRFKMAGITVQHIHKDRRARKAFIRASEKTLQRSVFEKYADVFRRLGYPDFQVQFRSLFPEGGADLTTTLPHFDASQRPERNWVAVAPFATYEGKIYPLPQMEQVVAQLAARGDVRIFLFGAGERERAVTEAWAARHPHTESMTGKLNGLAEEAALISHCRVMVAMDSANMHLASLVGVPVVSIWGATHPLGGFLGWGQQLDDAIQRTDLPCRPCSVFGNKPCQFGDYRCMTGITPEQALQRVELKIEN
ncbi:MAG: glycosyltransferase family 9 protein [Bacteroidaceae bacterium]|nr:glycosyltransferase family 9 protein [Bacteroidaceae bacterium]